MSYVDHVAAIKAALAELTRLAAQAKALAKDREAGRQLGAAERFELKAHVLELAVKTVRQHLRQVDVAADRWHPATENPAKYGRYLVLCDGYSEDMVPVIGYYNIEGYWTLPGNFGALIGWRELPALPLLNNEEQKIDG